MFKKEDFVQREKEFKKRYKSGNFVSQGKRKEMLGNSENSKYRNEMF